ncbi:DUF1304 domain-containing protein [Demequina zhanjiangensis]|uniref:DUF1304 domain-containing protein n=1 Tax=Demequina zhanjiangensis TaxID=3051659 RepID=A0ABT8G2Q8_9MICO|nr:DUF1304 domain-containing protein [Demequina sp. SYSU T00b26]MDN4473405.1 DUF1304 domain-containing protein [Demequina sp. SYSU T00b26]
MTTVGLVLAALAALLHVYIFFLESIAWMTPRARATFGIRSDEEAEHTRVLAFNQGFYNLFLALVTAIGIALLSAGSTAAGTALVLAGVGSMAAAAAVLVIGSRSHARAAAIQGTLPLLAVVLVTAGALA